MPGAEVVNLQLSPQEARRRRRRRWLKVGVPILGVALMLVAIGGIAAFSYTSNRRDALELSHSLVQAIERRIDTEIEAYLSPAPKMVALLRDVLSAQRPGPRRRNMVERLGLQILRANPPLASIVLGEPDGDFIMLKRMPDGTLHSKRIDFTGNERRTVWTRRDADGAITALEEEPNDTYDARARAWYRGAVDAGDELYWSDVYVFFSDRKAGLTVSALVRETDDMPGGVVGIDIDLEAISAFLGKLTIGKRGRAMIIDEGGRAVATPDIQSTLRDENGELVRARLDELGDPVLTRAFDHFRVQGFGQRYLEVEAARYIAITTPLELVTGRKWALLLLVAEDDFIGFIARNSRWALLMSLGIIALAALLAVLLARQGILADRNAMRLRERERTIAAQNQAYAELAANAALFDPDRPEAERRITEIVAQALGARRVSVWRLTADRHELVCDDCYDRDTEGHTAGTDLRREELPQAFAWLVAGTELAVRDTARDPRTAELNRHYLNPVGCQALVSVPIRRDTGTVGAVWVEDEEPRSNFADTLSFARAVAGMLAVRMTEPARGEALVAARTMAGAPARRRAVASRSALRNTSFAGDRARALTQRLSERGLAHDGLAAQIFPEMSVLSIRFTDHLTLAQRIGEAASRAMFDQLACAIEQIAARHGVDYLKVLGDQVTAAEGFEAGEDHATAMAEVALSVQEEGARLFAELDRRLGFRIGLDVGGVIGSAVGDGDRTYNLWGEAVRAALAMAESGSAGGIHVTESAYQRLRDRYLFRVRGSFYLERVGEMSTYLLVGRL